MTKRICRMGKTNKTCRIACKHYGDCRIVSVEIKPPKSIERRALEMACDRLLKVSLKDGQMTMYEGRWEAMVQDKAAHFLAMARGKK